MKTVETAAREFAATKIKDKNKQPDNDIFFAAKEGFEAGVEFAEKWYSIEDQDNPVPNEGDILIMLLDGSVRRYDEDWQEEFGTDGIVTHWKYINLPI